MNPFAPPIDFLCITRILSFLEVRKHQLSFLSSCRATAVYLDDVRLWRWFLEDVGWGVERACLPAIGSSVDSLRVDRNDPRALKDRLFFFDKTLPKASSLNRLKWRDPRESKIHNWYTKQETLREVEEIFRDDLNCIKGIVCLYENDSHRHPNFCSIFNTIAASPSTCHVSKIIFGPYNRADLSVVVPKLLKVLEAANSLTTFKFDKRCSGFDSVAVETQLLKGIGRGSIRRVEIGECYKFNSRHWAVYLENVTSLVLCNVLSERFNESLQHLTFRGGRCESWTVPKNLEKARAGFGELLKGLKNAMDNAPPALTSLDLDITYFYNDDALFSSLRSLISLPIFRKVQWGTLYLYDGGSLSQFLPLENWPFMNELTVVVHYEYRDWEAAFSDMKQLMLPRSLTLKKLCLFPTELSCKTRSLYLDSVFSPLATTLIPEVELHGEFFSDELDLLGQVVRENKNLQSLTVTGFAFWDAEDWEEHFCPFLSYVKEWGLKSFHICCNNPEDYWDDDDEARKREGELVKLSDKYNEMLDEVFESETESFAFDYTAFEQFYMYGK